MTSTASTTSPLPLSGKVALVTGAASRGIGQAIVRELAKQGATIAIGYSYSEEKANALLADLQSQGVTAALFKADLSVAKNAGEQVVAVHKHFGRLDILINNAGLASFGPTDQQFQDMWNVNTFSPYQAVKAASSLLSDGGRVITISSVAADRTGFPGSGEYSATKAAVNAFNRGWAADLAARGITANTVQPGPIDTEMTPGDGPMAPFMEAKVPLHRMGKATEVADLVAFLVSDKAQYITGSDFKIDGGAMVAYLV